MAKSCGRPLIYSDRRRMDESRDSLVLLIRRLRRCYGYGRSEKSERCAAQVTAEAMPVIINLLDSIDKTLIEIEHNTR